MQKIGVLNYFHKVSLSSSIKSNHDPCGNQHTGSTPTMSLTRSIAPKNTLWDVRTIKMDVLVTLQNLQDDFVVLHILSIQILEPRAMIFYFFAGIYRAYKSLYRWMYINFYYKASQTLSWTGILNYNLAEDTKETSPNIILLPFIHVRAKKLRRPGIEPGASRWQRDILPLNQRRFHALLVIWQSKWQYKCIYNHRIHFTNHKSGGLHWWNLTFIFRLGNTELLTLKHGLWIPEELENKYCEYCPIPCIGAGA